MSKNRNRNGDGSFEDIEAYLDEQSIQEQVDQLTTRIEDCRASMLLAHEFALRVIAAIDVGVTSSEQGVQFTDAVINSVKDLQAQLVIYWSGSNSARELLEQLHHIYYPARRPDKGLEYSLDDQLLAWRRGVGKVLKEGTRLGCQTKYWKLVEVYLSTHPDEPRGWQERISGDIKPTAG